MVGRDLKKFQIHQKISVKQAMRQMNTSSEKTLFVLDADQRLFGALTDGDIRRWILRKGGLKQKVQRICNTRPVYMRQGRYAVEDVKELMVNQNIEVIPVVDKEKRIVDILFWNDLFGKAYKKNQSRLRIPVVIMAGGKGERMAPFTQILPKPLIPVDEKPAIEWVMDSFHERGCDKFYITLGYKGGMIKSYFDNTRTDYKISYFEESRPLGTAGALRKLAKDLPQHFFLSNCDIIVKADYEDIYKFHKKNKYDITVIASMKHFVLPYGVIELDRGRLKRINEKPEYDLLVNVGMYVVQKKVISLIPERKMFHMTDLIKKVEKTGKVGIYPVNENSWVDVGEWEKYKEAVKKMAL